MSFRTILFDLDGTLTDPKEGITRCIQFALGELGAPVPEADQLLWCIGPALKHSFARLIPTDDAGQLDRAVFYYRQRFGTTGLFENGVYPEIPAALRTLRENGFRLLLATSKPHEYARRILERFELIAYFDAVYGSEMDGARTDKGELLRHLLEAERLAADAVVMVGDREHDVLGAKANGVRVAAVSYGYGTREELANAGPDWVFDSPSALAQFFITNRSALVSSVP